MPIIVLALGGMYVPVVQLNEALDFRLLLVTITIVLIVAMIAFRRPGIDESEMTRPFDDFDNVYEKDGDLWIKSEMVTITIVLIVAMIAFRRPGIDESEMTRPFDDFDNVYEKDGDLWIKSETHDERRGPLDQE